MPYVSITGLQLKSLWQYPRFFWHAAPSLRQARRAEGNLLAEARTIDGTHHTLTVWESKASMRAYIQAEPHRSAMRAFPSLARGKTYGFEADSVPSWHEARDLWIKHGRDYG